MSLAGTLRRLAVLAALGLAGSCARPPAEPPLFEQLAPAATGVAFENRLPERAEFSIERYLYYYNGGGVAVGDVDGDGRQDLYFSANVGPNKLYLNRGNFRFEDATARAGVAGPPGWKTGVAMADVTGDGRPDIYASAVEYLGMRGRNVLYVNNGDGTFTDRTDESGLAFRGYATQAAFLDYDGDGDLDCFLATHLTASERKVGGGFTGDPRHPRGGGVLFRNDGVQGGSRTGVPRFTDVTAQAGLTGKDGYALGVVASDLNADGRPDLYVAVDFQGNDRLLLNNGDGTFTDAVTRATGHTSRFSMGVDAADADGDGRPDVFVADMMPEREDVLKSSAATETFNLFNLRLRAGYHPQYARNTLQLNQGLTPNGDGVAVPRFSEVGYLAGVDATDWSWGALWADLDLDGRKDLFVTNGILRRPNDLDYINYLSNEAVQAALVRGDTAINRELLRQMPSIPLANHAFQNVGGPGAPQFRDRAAEWGLGEPGFSNGAAYVDLDDDGALDLVVNRVNAPALVYRSRARERTGNGALTVALRGEGANTAGVGARAWVTAGGRTQLVEQSPTRGFLSSVDPRLHVGLGRAARVDSLVVAWPDGRRQTLRGLPPNGPVTLRQADATCDGDVGKVDFRWRGNDRSTGSRVRGNDGGQGCRPRESGDPRSPSTLAPVFADATAAVGPELARWTHRENEFLDTDVQPLLPRLLSREGPALGSGDVNGDGLDDLYLGGAKWQPGRLFVQLPNGTFRHQPAPALAADSLAEDVAALFVDADGDGARDLVVAGGGNEFWEPVDAIAPRLYLGDGRGGFRRAPDAFPGVFVHAGALAAADYDADGDQDLFVGGRVLARQYGVAPRSYLLRNDGRGRFADVTDAVAPGLARAGMVTGATWVGGGAGRRPELVVVGEWMPVRVFRPEGPAGAGARLRDRTEEAGLAGTAGWWHTVHAADLTGDGRADLVLGNQGRNAYVKASAAEPARLYVHDFGGNGTVEQVLTFYKRGTSYPLAGRDDLVRLVPSLRPKFPSYASFGASTVEDIFPADELRRATVLEARTLESAVAVAGADGRYRVRPLPAAAQFAPVRAALAGDWDGDGRADLLLAGNDHGAPPVLGRYDAGYGVVLGGRGDGTFAPFGLAEGVLLEGEVRGLARVRTRAGLAVVAARNNAAPVVLQPRGAARREPQRTLAARR